jgi:hypothetical protein
MSGRPSKSAGGPFLTKRLRPRLNRRYHSAMRELVARWKVPISERSHSRPDICPSDSRWTELTRVPRRGHCVRDARCCCGRRESDPRALRVCGNRPIHVRIFPCHHPTQHLPHWRALEKNSQSPNPDSHCCGHSSNRSGCMPLGKTIGIREQRFCRSARGSSNPVRTNITRSSNSSGVRGGGLSNRESRLASTGSMGPSRHVRSLSTRARIGS